MEERGDAKLHHLSPQTHPRRRLGTSAAAPFTVPDAMAAPSAASAPPWPEADPAGRELRGRGLCSAMATRGLHAGAREPGEERPSAAGRGPPPPSSRPPQGREREEGRGQPRGGPAGRCEEGGRGRTGLGSIGLRWRRSICALLAQARRPPPRRLPLSSLGSPRCSCGGAPRWPRPPPSFLVAVKAMAGLLQLPPPAGCGAAPPPPSPARWRPGEGPRGELVRGSGGHARARA